jgi:N-acetylglutamate synthase-like GNAT family acetyltransferase
VSAAHPTVRRANLDDLPVLRGLWQSACLPGYELEKRLTEFHVALRPDGLVTGTRGFQVAGPHALLHSPAFPSPALAAEALPALWEQALALAQTQGVARLWLRGPAAVHWQEAGFQAATPAQLKRLPAALGPARGDWWTVALRDEAAAVAALEKEFAALHEAEQEHTERLQRQAAFWRFLAWGIAALFLAGAVWMGLVMFQQRPRRRNR